MIQNSNERKPTRLLQITLSARPVCSEGFVNTVGGTPPPVVPEPTGIVLAGLGIAGLLYRRRRAIETSPAKTT